MKNLYALALQLLFMFVASTAYSQVTLLSENFNGTSTPTGWTVINNSVGGVTGGPSAAAWTLRDNLYSYTSNFLSATFQSNDASRFYLSNSDAQGDDLPFPLTNTILQLPVISTLGYSNVSMQFHHAFSSFTSADSALVEASLDGISWTKVFTANFATAEGIGLPNSFVALIINLDAYANQSAVYLRFHYWASFGYFWAIDNVTITASGAVVPVQLLNFSGYRTGNKNILNWATSSESNNRGFHVERSVDGVHFTPIGFVNSLAVSGNSTSTLRYVFEDLNAGPAKQFYRLRQMDIDGLSKLSNIVHIIGGMPQMLSVASSFPIPTHSQLNVVITSPVNELLQLSIIDSRGVILQQEKTAVSPGSNTLQVNAEKLAPGQYSLRIYSENAKRFHLETFIKL